MNIDHEQIMRRVAEISPPLAENAGACDAARQLVPQSMRLMVDAGVFKILQPQRVGGYELPMRTAAEAVSALSEACSSSGWVLMVMGAHHWVVGCLPERAQDDVFGGGRDGLVAGTLSWQGTANTVAGGYRVNGRWQFCSGVDYSQWVMLGCADPKTRGPGVHLVVPRNEIEIDDTWHVMGLQGTGSKDVVAHDIFVPAHRAIETRALFMGASPDASKHTSNLYHLSAEAMLATSGLSALVGQAKTALRRFIERTRERKVILTGARKADHGPTQVRLAEAAGEIDCADLMLHNSLDQFDRLMASGENCSNELRVRARWNAAYGVELCRRAVARMFAGSGAHAVYAPSELQVSFRNIQVGAQHASMDFDSSAEMYARLRLGETK
jgi:3-hydroxy-9,10-secoandrosta-1,3,5(10)-triene-9,17-dione monooxygenase